MPGSSTKKSPQAPPLGPGWSCAPIPLAPPHDIPFHFCGALAGRSECCYGMCCGTKGAEIQKLSDLLERPPPTSPPPPPIVRFSSSTHVDSFLLCCSTSDAPCPLTPPFPPTACKNTPTTQSRNNTPTCQHVGLLHASSHTRGRNVCGNVPSGYLCNLHVKLLRGRGGRQTPGSACI